MLFRLGRQLNVLVNKDPLQFSVGQRVRELVRPAFYRLGLDEGDLRCIGIPNV